MRKWVVAVLVGALAGPAWGQPIAPLTGTTAAPPTGPTTVPATPPAPSASTMSRRQRAAFAFQQRFDAANTTHDGKLTLDQAKAAHMAMVVRYFDQIDAAHRGYITTDDIRTYRRNRRHARAVARRERQQQQGQAPGQVPGQTPAPAPQ